MRIVFFSPFFAYLIPLVAALPFIIHLLTRARKKKMVFSSVRLFEEIIKKSGRKFLVKRWQRIFILILRAAILGMLISIPAGPWLSSVGKIRSISSGGVGKGHNIVFLFDVSMSRSIKTPSVEQETTGDAFIQKDKKIAAGIIELLKNRFADIPRIAVISYASDIEKIFSGLTDSSSGGGEILPEVLPTAKGTSHLRGLEAAVNMLRGKDENPGRSVGVVSPRGTIFWFTDLAEHGFRQSFSDESMSRDSGVSNTGKKFHPRFRLPDGVNLVVVTSNPLLERTAAYSNLALEGVERPQRGSTKDEAYFFDALARSYEFEGLAFARLYSVSADGREKLIFEMPVNIKKNRLNRIRCFLPRGFDENKQVVGEGSPLMRFEIKGDEFLIADNSYYFKVESSRKKLGDRSGGLKVLVVDGNPQPGRLSNVFYIESALKSSSVVGSVKTVTFVDFITAYRNSPREVVEGYDAVIFSDFWPSEPYITDSESAVTDSWKNYFAEDKLPKVVIFFPGERLIKSKASVADINGIRFYPGDSAGNPDNEATVKAMKRERIYNVKIDGYFFKEILGIQGADGFDWDVSFKKIHTISYDGSEYIPAATVTDGENLPLIISRRQDYSSRKGMFFFVNTTSSREWSDFCAKPVFAVLIEKMILSARRRFEFAGEDGGFAGGDIYGFAGEIYHHSVGADFYKRLFYEDIKKKKMFPFVIPPEEPGIYRIKSTGRRFDDSFYLVNTLPSESDIRQVEKIDDFVEKGKRDSWIYIIRYYGGGLSSRSVEEHSLARAASRAVTAAFGKDLRKEIIVAVLILIVAENILMALWTRT